MKKELIEEEKVVEKQGEKMPKTALMAFILGIILVIELPILQLIGGYVFEFTWRDIRYIPFMILFCINLVVAVVVTTLAGISIKKKETVIGILGIIAGIFSFIQFLTAIIIINTA